MGNIVFGLLSFSAALLQLVLVLHLLWQQGFRKPLLRAFLVGGFAIVIWNAGYTVMYFTSDPDVATRAYRLSAIGWAALPAVLIYYSWLLQCEVRDQKSSGYLSALLTLLSLCLIRAGLRGRLLAYRLERAAIGWIEHMDMGTPASLLYLVLAVGSIAYTGIVVWRIWTTATSNKHRQQVRSIAFPALGAVVISLTANLLLPIAGVHIIPPLGNVAMAIWIGFVGVAMARFPILSVSSEFAVEAVLAHMRDMLFLVDADSRIRRVNPAVTRSLGYATRALVGQELQTVLTATNAARLAAIERHPEDDHSAEVTTFSGETIPCRLVVRLLHDRFHDPVGYMVLLHDMRELQRLEQASHTDHLTGAANRRRMDLLLESEIARYQRYRRAFAVILFDIDHFKRVNDTYGHVVGDQVLIRLSRCVLDAVRTTDTAGRWGGEEFLVLCPETPLTDALNYAERLRATIAALPPEGSTPTVTASFGVAVCRPDDTLESLVHRADTALYLAKQRGRNQVATTEETA